MSKVTLIKDYFKLVHNDEPNQVYIVNGIDNYSQTYQRMLDAIYNKKPLTIAIRHRTVWQWFYKAAQKYSTARIEFEELKPKDALRRKWGIVIPDWISDNDIIKSDIMNIDISIQEGQAFENIILGNTLSKVLTFKELPTELFVTLVKESIENSFEENLTNPVIKKVFNKRIKQWEKSLSVDWKSVIDQWNKYPKHLLNQLEIFKVLKNYPEEYGKRVLEADWELLKRINVNLDDLNIPENEVERAVQQVRIFFNDFNHRLKEAPTNFNDDYFVKLVGIMSGVLFFEYEQLKRIIDINNIPLDQKKVLLIQQKFSGIKSRIGHELNELSNLIEPSRPPAPSTNCSIEDWMDWAVHDYLPYRFWLEENNLTDKEINHYSSMYGDWLYENFTVLRSTHQFIVYRVISNVVHQLMNNQNVTLFIVIDNFNYKHLHILKELFKTKGYLPMHKETPYLSMIPSETEVSKRCIFSGEPEQSSVPNKSYKDLIQSAWGDHLQGDQLEYLPNIGGLINLKSLDKKVYMLNYLELDKILHDDERDTGIPHSGIAASRLEGLINAVDSFARKFQIEDILDIMICSDHGSTRISQTDNNEINNAYYKNKKVGRGYRYVEIADDQINRLSENVRDQCYILDRIRFGLNKNYLIAKGYYRFESTSYTTYVHGGLTPEETIVPFVTFTKKKVKLEKPQVRLLSNEFRFSVKSNITLEISNVNANTLEDINMSIRPSSIESSYTIVGNIREYEVKQAEISCKIPNKSKIKSLTIVLEFSSSGKSYKEEYEFEIKMKQMMDSTSLDDFFNDF